MPAYTNAELRNAAVRAENMLRRVYREHGPGASKGNGKLNPAIYAKMTKAEVDEHYDFYDRHLMHAVAKIIAV